MPDTVELSEAKRRLLTQYRAGKTPSAQISTTIPRRSLGEPALLSFAQEQVWLHAQMAPQVPLYNEPVTIRYRGVLDPAAFERSFNEVLRRHEAWRTCFVISNGSPEQKIESSIYVSLPAIDLRHLSAEQREAEALRIATKDARKPLDLATAPLLRARLIRLADEEHRLYLTLSHIIFDGVAIYRVFLPELSTIYAAFSAGQPSPLPEPPIQHADFCAWQRKSSSKEKLQNDMEYWRKQLGSGLPALDLPADRKRPPVQTFNGSMYPFVLNRRLTNAVRRTCKQEGVSSFQLLLAGFAALLYRYCGNDQIAIGSVTAGRDLPETNLLLGYFLNTVVMRADIGGNPSFRQLARRMRDLTLETLQHDSVPFGELIQAFGPVRDRSRNPLFDVMFSLEPPMPEVTSAWQLTQMDVDCGASKYDLYLELDERREEILARFHYSTDLFDLSTIERMAGHWITLLEAALADPSTAVSALPMLTQAEQGRFSEWNETASDYPCKLPLQDLLAAQCERSPEAPAVLAGDDSLTYGQLDRRSNQLAQYLRKQGVADGWRVGLCLDRSISMMVAIAAILKAGAAYVPLDPKYPAERLAFMLEDSQAGVLITEKKLAAKFPSTCAKPIILDEEWETIAKEDATQAPVTKTRAEDPAYLMYTSGSTGRPKGVLGTHRATINRLAWMWRAYPFQAEEICCQKTSLSFVDSVWEVFGPLLQGVPLVLISDEDVRDIESLVEILATRKITRIVLVPSLLRAMLQSELLAKLCRLKLWICSGETLTVDLAEAFLQRMPEARLLNLYGSTEVAGDATYQEIRARVPAQSIPIGRPIANTRAYVLDSQLRAVPVNVAGEIYIGGDALSLGYWNRPELTEERFLKDPFSQPAAAVLFRTGDLGRFRGDGTIEYLGRRDHQVKIRGFRVELGEIEAIFRSNPGIRNCVAVTREDKAGSQRIVVYFEPAEAARPSIAELQTYLKKQLPDYMIPSGIIPMEHLPLTSNGKIDRKALPSYDDFRIAGSAEFVPPSDELEQVLATIWASVLGIGRVSVNHNFFDLGGHSLAAVRMLFEVKNALGRTLPLAVLFHAATVREFAALLRDSGWQPSWSSLVPILGRGSKRPLFLVHGAEGNILLYRHLVRHLGADQPVYGLQSQGLNGGAVRRDIAEMAAHYIKEIMMVQPHGPFRLGGYCLGGIIAFEMAQQLRKLGEEVETVIMLDTYNPAATSRSSLCWKRPLHLLQNLWFHAANFLLLDSGERRKFVREKIDIELTRFRIRADAGLQFFRRISGGESRSYPHLAIKKNNDEAWLGYVPQPYAGRVLLVRSKSHFLGFRTPSLGWHEVAPNLEVRELPLYPKGMLIEPFCQSLAALLDSCVESPGRSRAATAAAGSASRPELLPLAREI